MKKIAIKISLLICALLFSITSSAEDLLQIYALALKNDPTFKAAEATMMANKQAMGIARSILLPNLDLSGSAARSYRDFSNAGRFYNTNTQYLVSITQPIFNLTGWKSIANARAIVKQAEATYSFAAQDLMLRAATAYFDVLNAYDTLHFSLAEQKATARLLEQNEERFKVGLIAITDVQQTRAQYDTISAQVISDRNEIANRLEELREITGEFNNKLATIKTKLPLVKPEPTDINQWVSTALQQNYNLQAASYAMQAAKENIGVQSSARWPVLNAAGNYSYDRDNNPGGQGIGSRQNIAAAALSLDFPVYQGGLITANTRQASYLYAQATATREAAYRSTVANTRKSYLGVLSGIAVIQADKQAVVSSESSLKATEASYIVGTQTMFDVLNAQSILYEQEKNLANDQYSYLISTLTLKQAAGTLGVKDLAIINSWLSKKQIDFSVYDTRQHEPNYQIVSHKTLIEPIKRPKFKPTTKQPAPTSTTKPAPSNTTKPVPPPSTQQPNVNTSKGYTIQLLAGSSKQKALDFIRKNNLQEKAVYFETTNRGKPWYEVIYGKYNTSKQANNALKKLAVQLKKFQPWVRSLSSIKATIERS